MVAFPLSFTPTHLHKENYLAYLHVTACYLLLDNCNRHCSEVALNEPRTSQVVRRRSGIHRIIDRITLALPNQRKIDGPLSIFLLAKVLPPAYSSLHLPLPSPRRPTSHAVYRPSNVALRTFGAPRPKAHELDRQASGKDARQ